LLEIGKIHKIKALFEGCAFSVQIEYFLDYGAANSARGLGFNGPNFNDFSLLSTAKCRVFGNLFKPDQRSCTNVLAYKTGKSLICRAEDPATDKLKLAR
jgi:hypothetical protein